MKQLLTVTGNWDLPSSSFYKSYILFFSSVHLLVTGVPSFKSKKYSVTLSSKVRYFPGLIAPEGIAGCLRSRDLCG